MLSTISDASPLEATVPQVHRYVHLFTLAVVHRRVHWHPSVQEIRNSTGGPPPPAQAWAKSGKQKVEWNHVLRDGPGPTQNVDFVPFQIHCSR